MYQVILNGVHEDFARSEVVKNLAILFKTTPEQVVKLLESSGSVIKKGINYDVALKYKAALAAAGATCQIHEEITLLKILDVDLPTQFPLQVVELRSESENSVMAPPKIALVSKLNLIYFVIGLIAIVAVVIFIIHDISIKKEAQLQADKAQEIRLKIEHDNLAKLEAEQLQETQRQAAIAAKEAEGFDATFTCGLESMNHLNILGCFIGDGNGNGTELEIRNGESYGMYKAYQLKSIGFEDSQGFHIHLNSHFMIAVQNAQSTLLLGLIIKDGSGKVVFQKSAGRYGVIRVNN